MKLRKSNEKSLAAIVRGGRGEVKVVTVASPARGERGSAKGYL